MKFTIVTPSFNQAKYITRTIHSVLSQKQENIELEYIVRDNCSTDGTQDLLNFFAEDKRLKISIANDQGQADAINQGWLNGNGDILGWLNSDDVYFKDTLEIVADFFACNPSVMAIYGEAVYIDELDKCLKPVTNIRDYSRNLLLNHDFITQPATFIRRQVFERVGPLSYQYRYVFDWEYWMRISQYYDFVRLPVLLAGYRITGDNLTTRGGHQRLIEMLGLTWHSGGTINVLRFLARLGKKYMFGEPEIPPARGEGLISS
jgi:glycosyltransferase involved in cell wall biosynthesis